MTLADALSKSKIAMLRWSDKLVLVTSTAAYEAMLKDPAPEHGAWIFTDFKSLHFNSIPNSNKWEALGYHEK